MSDLLDVLSRALRKHNVNMDADAAQKLLFRIAADGYVMAPKNPTLHQLAEGQRAWLRDPERRSSTLYHAMVAASPYNHEPPPPPQALTGERRCE